MTSYVTPKKNAEFIYYLPGLPSVANPDIFQVNPTLATGDVKVSIDGGALANLTTLPTVTPAGGTQIKITWSAGEMNGDNITTHFLDAAGNEWKQVGINVQTSARQIDDLATPTNITAGTITTVTNLTNAPTSGDLTATMKTSVTTAATAATPVAASVTGNVGGNVTGSVGSVVGLTASNLDAAVSTRATPAQVNAEVVDALATDTYAEPGQGTPSATASIAAKINYLFKAWRNKTEQTASQYSLYNDAGNVIDQKASTSDNGTTFQKTEVESGP